MTDNNDILERLKHPEQEAERRKKHQDLFIRNVLNAIFMILAAIAMVGLVFTWNDPEMPRWCYILGLIAVLVKMVEAMFRMPGIMNKPKRSQRRTPGNNP